MCERLRRALLCLAAPLLLAGCGVGTVEGPGYTQISQEEAARMMEREDGCVIVDVRRLYEYEESHIPGAVLIPNESIGQEPPELLPDKDQIILVYCRSGNRSKQAAQKLADLGYTRVYEFGGILDWTGPLITREREAAVSRSVTLTVDFGSRCLYAHLENNASAAALTEKLNAGSIAVTMTERDGAVYLGLLPWELPASEEEIRVQPGDILLRQDKQICICVEAGSGSYTRLARIGNCSGEQLLELLDAGDGGLCFWLEWSE
jgi:rhodanese-related sulfurtransferase